MPKVPKHLVHLVSKTKSSHGINAKKWVNPKDRIPFWNIVPGDKVMVARGDDKIKYRIGTVGTILKSKNQVLLKDEWAARPARQKFPLMLKNAIFNEKFNLHFKDNVILRPRAIAYSNLRLVVGSRQVEHEVDGKTYRTYEPIIAKRLRKSGFRFSKAKRRVIWDRKPEGKVYLAIRKSVQELQEAQERTGKWPKITRTFLPLNDFNTSQRIRFPRTKVPKTEFEFNPELQTKKEISTKKTFEPLSIDELTHLAQTKLNLRKSNLPNSTSNVIEYKAQNDRPLSALDASVTEFMNPHGRGQRTRAYNIARGIKPKSIGRGQPRNTKYFKNLPKGYYLALSKNKQSLPPKGRRTIKKSSQTSITNKPLTEAPYQSKPSTSSNSSTTETSSS